MYRGLKVGSVEANHQPWVDGSVDRLELIVDEVMLSAALTKVNLSGELDEEDGAVGERVPAHTHMEKKMSYHALTTRQMHSSW